MSFVESGWKESPHYERRRSEWHLKMRNLPRVIAYREHVPCLELEYCDIESFAPLNQLPDLCHLRISDCIISETMEDGECFDRIKYLSLSYHNSPNLSWLRFFPNLLELEVEAFTITDTEIDFAPIANLQQLTALKFWTNDFYFSYNPVKNLWMLPSLYNLVELSLDCEYEPQYISQLQSLEILTLLKYKSEFNFSHLYGLRKLRELHLEVEDFIDITSLKKMSNLQSITLSRFPYFPDNTI